MEEMAPGHFDPEIFPVFREIVLAMIPPAEAESAQEGQAA